MSSKSHQKISHPGWGGFCILLGLYPVSIALGVLDVPPEDVLAPMWVLGLSGLCVIIVGCMLIVGQGSLWNDFFAGILCLAFGALGLWVALFAPAEGISGGIPLLPEAANTSIGRWVFGLGSVISFSISGWAFHLWVTALRNAKQ